MDQYVNDEAPALQHVYLREFLTAFSNLSEINKSAAIQYILQHNNPAITISNTPSEMLGTTALSAHSCSFCRKFVLGLAPGAYSADNDLVGFDAPMVTTGEMDRKNIDLIRPRVFVGHSLFSRQFLFESIQHGCILAREFGSIIERNLPPVLEDNTHLESHGVPSISATPVRLINAAGIIATVAVRKTALELGYTNITMDPSMASLPPWGMEATHRVVTGYQNFTLPDDPVATLISQRPSADIDAEGSFVQARRWLYTCQKSHSNGHCCKQDGLLPSRVIDIGTRFPIRTVKLHWTDEGETGPYVSLSYCWGGKQTLITTLATVQDFTDGIVFSKLPQTLQDAVITTFKLGLRYIWIDALCIIQDDTEDVNREISRMAQVYSEATVTISAASAKGVQDGFLESRRLPEANDPPIRMSVQTETGDTGSIYLQKKSGEPQASEEDPITLRAWTLQEHVLSKRILMYSRQDLWWGCASTTEVANHEGVNSSFSATLSTRSNASIHAWRNILRDYSRRFLTYPNDKLTAIAGVATYYGDLFNSAYHAGLWEFCFKSELMWSSKRGDISRPPVRRAPSWSWAAVDGEICHDLCTNINNGSGVLTVYHCEVSPTSRSSPFGPVNPLRSSLLVESEIGCFYWRPDKEHIYVNNYGTAATITQVDPEPLPKDVARTRADAAEPIPLDERNRMVVWALMVNVSDGHCLGTGLLLAQVTKDTFRRVGVFDDFGEMTFYPRERRTIEIV